MKKIVLITGASSGIGKSIANNLTNNGYIVYGTSRNPVKYIETYSFTLLKLDVSDEKSINFILKKILKKHSRIDILINNAGIGLTGSIEETPIIELKNNFQTNFFGPINLIQSILPIMRHNNFGRIINITSIGGYMGLPYRGGYSASKGALSLVSEALRIEVKDFNIKVSTIAPGDFKTDISSRRFHTPIKNNSPYYKNYKRVLDTINDHIDLGKNPDIIAKEALKILNFKEPKPHYNIGSFIEKSSLFLKFILPQKIYEYLIIMVYKL
tara:strand:- start:1486 stop:2292 length:807 start_codon:yes stop_codon:yes gene_type:complete